ncbi:cytokinin riboside 5'-monophosphate phosphoribohydrolase, partial [Lecanoromycetidae sp. Uapishka_2]
MSTPPTRICVFCSSTTGTSPSHLQAARDLATVLHAHNIHLVYGGGTTGLMGELARTLVQLYGDEEGPKRVHGVIPSSYLSIERPEDPVGGGQERRESWVEKARNILAGKRAISKASDWSLLSEAVYGRTTIVADVQIRKKAMCNEVNTGGAGSGFIGLSGGFGTMDELMEMVTWRQLGVHNKPVCLLNVDGFWDHIVGWMEDAVGAGFVRSEGKRFLAARDTPQECVEWLADCGRSKASKES